MAVRRWGLGGVVALLLMLAAMVQPAAASAENAGSGQAVQAPPSCPAGMLCAWTGTDFTGRLVVIDPSTLGECWGLTQNETLRSVWNASASSAQGWITQFCWGVSTFIPPGTGGNTPFPVQSFSR